MLRERFSRPLDRAALELSESTREDLALLPADLWGSRVHARMLAEVGLIPRRAARRIDRTLRGFEARAAKGRFPLRADLEDVHLNVEAALTRAIGSDGERLHTARSRNDQVATDLAVFLRGELLSLELELSGLAETLRRRGSSPAGRRVVAGWTHLQPAQRVYLGQILATHALRFLRDAHRLDAIRLRLDESPLGSGALAGTSLPIDRERTARLLGFARPSRSSLDAVSDRDAQAETLGALALFAAHASGLAEELVVGSIPELGRVRLDDAFVTTSSLMPHKRNPDLAELVRGETGPAVGRLAALLVVLKGLPLAYNRDLQVGKPIVIEGLARSRLLVRVLEGMIATAEWPATRTAPEPSDTASVELVDRLVLAGVPFRVAHRRVAKYLSGASPPKDRWSPSRVAIAFPELSGPQLQLPLPHHEPEARQSAGGSSWAEVSRLLTEVRERSGRYRRAALAEARRLDRLHRSLDGPLRVRPRDRRAGRSRRG
ncbi:MAG TPA: argininosuccinate lyase [Thermoplasmata archaeon]|nr:argininosuccinate lyase [Thermoplasmata archaeon]